LTGKDIKNVKISLPLEIIDAYEVNGQEKKIGEVKYAKNGLQFDLGHYGIKSFAVKLKGMSPAPVQQQSVEIPYNVDVISSDENRNDGTMFNGQSLPAEQLPEYVEKRRYSL